MLWIVKIQPVTLLLSVSGAYCDHILFSPNNTDWQLVLLPEQQAWCDRSQYPLSRRVLSQVTSTIEG